MLYFPTKVEIVNDYINLRYPTISYISFLHLTHSSPFFILVAVSHIHIGTNQGDLLANLQAAIRLLEDKGEVVEKSHIYETEAWGKEDQPNFYNLALTYDTKLDPHDLLRLVNDIEDELGRVRNEKWSERIIDLDIITYDDKIICDDQLTIPHHHMAERNFVLIPMMEIAGDWLHPQMDKTIDELYIDCHDTCEVILIETEI